MFRLDESSNSYSNWHLTKGSFVGSSDSRQATVKSSSNMDILGKVMGSGDSGIPLLGDQCGGRLRFAFEALPGVSPGENVHIDSTEPGLLVGSEGPVGRLNDSATRHIRGCISGGYSYKGEVVTVSSDSRRGEVELVGGR